MTALQGFTDAAGGSLDSFGNGIGAFLPLNTWAYVPFGFRINGPGVDETGKKLCLKMSACGGDISRRQNILSDFVCH